MKLSYLRVSWRVRNLGQRYRPRSKICRFRLRNIVSAEDKMHITNRRSQLLGIVLVGILVIAMACTKNPEALQSGQLVNGERARRNTAELIYHGALVDKAQNWAEHLAATGTIRHSTLSANVGPGWRTLGENVAKARTIEQAHALLMGSNSHRNTLLNPRYNSIGVGVAESGGWYYVVQVFGG